MTDPGLAVALRRAEVDTMCRRRWASAGIRKGRLYDAWHACLTFLATSGVPDVVVSAWTTP